MSSFQGVHIEGEGFHCIQRCLEDSTLHRGVLISGCWNRGVPQYTEMSLFQEVGIEEFHCIIRGVLISGCWNRGVPLYTEVSSFRELE